MLLLLLFVLRGTLVGSRNSGEPFDSTDSTPRSAVDDAKYVSIYLSTWQLKARPRVGSRDRGSLTISPINEASDDPFHRRKKEKQTDKKKKKTPYRIPRKFQHPFISGEGRWAADGSATTRHSERKASRVFGYIISRLIYIGAHVCAPNQRTPAGRPESGLYISASAAGSKQPANDTAASRNMSTQPSTTHTNIAAAANRI
jgi:hypothetical protein